MIECGARSEGGRQSWWELRLEKLIWKEAAVLTDKGHGQACEGLVAEVEGMLTGYS